MHSFPDKIYVKKEQYGNNEFLLAGEQPSEIAKSEETIWAGEYKLVRIVSLANKTIMYEVEDDRSK